MAFIPKGSPIFDQLPSQFESFFPSEQSFADGKLSSVLARAGGKNVDLLTRVQAETITQGLQLVQQQKAVLVGDFLTARMPQLVGFAADQWGQKVPQGLFASVPFPTSAIEDPLLNAMAGVGLNLALNAISAVPIVGKIIGLVVNIGMALAKLFSAQNLDPELPPLLVPWTKYGRDKDEDLVNKGLILTTAGRVDWTHVWLPGLGGTWSYERVADGNGKEMPGGRVFAPLDGKQVGWSKGIGLGAIPNTLRVAGPVQTLVDRRLRDLAHAGDKAAANEWEREKRYILRGDSREKAEGLGVYHELERPPSVIDTGAFYPAFAGIAGQLWQQVQQRGNPDMFKVEANVVRDAWQDYWGAFFEDGFALLDNLRGKKNSDDQAAWLWAALTPYISVIQQNGKSVTLGMANIDRPHPGPLVTSKIFTKGHGPGPLELRTGSLYAEVRTPDGWDQLEEVGDMAVRDWSGRIISPARIVAGSFRGLEARSQPWPTGAELFSYYQRPDQAIITPACDALGRAQLRSLETTLVCAYVRPVESGGMPAYAAFTGKGTALRDRCLAVRALLLKHEARFEVDLADVDAVDPAYAALLRKAGVGKSATSMKLSGGKARPLVEDPSGSDEAPIPPADGLAFDELRPLRKGRVDPPSRMLRALAIGASVAATGAGAYAYLKHRRHGGEM
jgi:hypothetical protein